MILKSNLSAKWFAIKILKTHDLKTIPKVDLPQQSGPATAIIIFYYFILIYKNYLLYKNKLI